jgi:hypothetical protein
MGTSAVRKARVLGTRITVVTGQVADSATVAFHAAIARGAAVLIIAIKRIGREDAAQFSVTGIIRTRITIFTRGRGARATGTVRTHIALGASVAVITRLRVVRVHATGRDVATVRRAQVSIVTGHLRALTCTTCARITAGTGVSIVAAGRIGLE